jgi:hypothetical protein
MIVGGHSIIYSANAEADRAFLRDVLRLPHVDVGRGWLIFGLPPAELAVHPADGNDRHEFYFMCDDVKAFVTEMSRHNIECAVVQDQGYGLVTSITLPGGGKLGVYEPRHARPASMATKPEAKPAAKRRQPAAKSRKATAKTAKKPKKAAAKTGKKTGRRR